MRCPKMLGHRRSVRQPRQAFERLIQTRAGFFRRTQIGVWSNELPDKLRDRLPETCALVMVRYGYRRIRDKGRDRLGGAYASASVGNRRRSRSPDISVITNFCCVGVAEWPPDVGTAREELILVGS
jgi:hypothetical protein